MTGAPQSGRTGRKPSVPMSPEAMRKALDELLSLPTVEVRTFAVLFKIGNQAAYAAARSGRFGCIRFGAQFRFPSTAIREALGLPQPIAGAASPSEGDAP